MDYVATHAYSGNADWDMQSINTIYQRSVTTIITIIIVVIVMKITVNKTTTRWGKKVWFTEFARPTTRDPAMELEYMQVVIVIATIAMIIISIL